MIEYNKVFQMKYRRMKRQVKVFQMSKISSLVSDTVSDTFSSRSLKRHNCFTSKIYPPSELVLLNVFTVSKSGFRKNN